MIEKFKSNAEAIATADKYLYGNHARMPIVMDRGEGCWVWDLDNNKYLDFVGGIAVNGLGHHLSLIHISGQQRDPPGVLQIGNHPADGGLGVAHL